jgi:hypothetical protein
MMQSNPIVYLVVGLVLILLMVLPRWLWRRGQTAPTVPKRTRAKREPKPFEGYTHKPQCELCHHGMDSPPQSPTAPPPRMIFTRGRRRQVDTTGQFCPQATGPAGVSVQEPTVLPHESALQLQFASSELC